MIQIFDIIVIVLAGTMVGNEFAIAAFIHPTLSRQQDSVHLPSASGIARVLGRFMPFWYGVVLALLITDIVLRWHAFGRWPLLLMGAATLWALAIVYTISMLVPINSRIAAYAPSASPADWKSDRKRWDLLHRWRVLILVVGLILAVIGIVSSPTPSHL